MENNNTIDMQNESLHDAATKYALKMNDGQRVYIDFYAGANWQKEKDKAIIDKAFHLLQWAHKVINASVPKQAGYGAIEILPEIEQLLNQLK